MKAPISKGPQNPETRIKIKMRKKPEYINLAKQKPLRLSGGPQKPLRLSGGVQGEAPEGPSGALPRQS